VTDAIEEGNTDEAQTILQDTIKSVIVPNTLRSRKAKEWFNKDCYRAKRTAIVALHAALKNQSETHLREYAKARKQYK
jgi:hypothetical protein